MRAISVSMSPSRRSSCAICAPTHGLGRRSAGPARCRKQWARKRAWLSLITLRKSGIWQTSHSRRTAPGMAGERRHLGVARQELQAPGGRRRRASGSGPAPAAARRGCASSAPTVSKRSRVLRQESWVKGSNRCSSTAATIVGIERPFIGRGAEGAVAHVPAGAPGDLGDLGGRQPARPAPVELGERGRRRHGPDPC